jgi:site-specific DNA recombinase
MTAQPAQTQTTTTTTTAPAALAVYMRVSSDEQRQQGTIENQRTAADRYLALYAITPYAWYADDGVSGTVPFASRPEGARLLADALAGRVRTVLIWRLDRMGRNALALLQVVETLERAGVRLVSITESFDTSTPAGRLQLNMLATIAQFERDSIIQRSDEGVARRLERSAWMGGRANIGYRVEGKDTHAHLVRNDTIDSASGYSEVDVVRLAWHLLVEQDWTTERIAEHLDTLGIPTRSTAEGAACRQRTSSLPGTPCWSPTVIYRMLRNPIYAGVRTVRAKDGTLHSHPVPAILTAEQVERARAVLRTHCRYPAARATHDYLLRDLLRCGQCGALYATNFTQRCTSGPHAGERVRYYVCGTRRYRMVHSNKVRVAAGEAPRDCHGPSVVAERIEAQIWADVEQFARDPGKTLLELAAAAGDAGAQAETHRTALAAIQQQLDAQQTERDTIFTKYRKGHMSERDLDHQLAQIAEEEADIIAKRDALLTALADATTHQERLEGARTLLQQLHARLDDPEQPVTPAVQREMVEALVKFIRVETVEIGLSTRGRMKRQAQMTVCYTFKRPKVLPAPAQQQSRLENLSPARST